MGATHDDFGPYKCPDGYVMGDSDPSSKNKRKFSSCSIDYFKANILNNGFDKKTNQYIFIIKKFNLCLKFKWDKFRRKSLISGNVKSTYLVVI